MTTVLREKITLKNTLTATPVEHILRTQLRILLCGCFYYSGLIGLIHWYKRRLEPHLVVLTYHEASTGNLYKHMRYLRKYYRIEHLENALVEFYGNPEQLEKPTRKADHRVVLVVTFDDGYYDNYTHGLAAARELKVPITIFLVPTYADSGQRYWWNEIKSLDRFVQVKEATFDGRTYQMDQPSERAMCLQYIEARLRYASSVAEREQFLAMVHQTLCISSAYLEEKAELPAGWEELKEMEASGWVSFGAHTARHPFLSHLSSKDEVVREVIEGRALLEQKLGHPVNIFAYPGGLPEHIGTYGRDAVYQAGFDWAVSMSGNVNTLTTDPLMLKRIHVHLPDHWLVMAAKTTGLLDFLFNLRQSPATVFKTWFKRV